MARCAYIDRPKTMFPCVDCEYKGRCETDGGKAPLTCEQCREYDGIDKRICEHRRGYNIRPCKSFEWE